MAPIDYERNEWIPNDRDWILGETSLLGFLQFVTKEARLKREQEQGLLAHQAHSC